MCRQLVGTSALGLWADRLEDILYHGRMRMDRNFVQHDMLLDLLQIVAPRLPLSTNSMPRDYDKVKAIMTKAWKRYQWLEKRRKKKASGRISRTEPEPPPVKIVVLGGSVTYGNNCYTMKGGNLFRCSWPKRLETFLNRYFGWTVADIVSVHNLASGGTNTQTAQAMVEYDLFPIEAKDPDIIINAYATNDMHVTTMKEAHAGGSTLRDQVFNMAQSFIRTVMDSSCGRDPPLLVWLDDYLGNEQNQIKVTTHLAQEIQTLANYYGFGFWSYPNMVRDIVYGDTHGTIFAPPWYKNGKFQREIHYGQGMHAATFWLVAYNLLNLATNYCTMEEWNVTSSGASAGFPQKWNGKEQTKMSLLPHTYQPKSLPPPLTDDLSLQHVSRKWQQEADISMKCTSQSSFTCAFSWLNGLARDESVQTIKSTLRSVVKEYGSWQVTNDGYANKFGLSPNVKDTVTHPLILELTKLKQAIGIVTLFPMKSYGDKWRDSTATVTLLRKSNDSSPWHLIDSWQVSGFHNKNTSEVYTLRQRLKKQVNENDSLRLELHLSGGTTFKLMGLAFCG